MAGTLSAGLRPTP